MIAALSGKLKRKATDYLVVDIAGVGYQVSVPLSTYCCLPDPGKEIDLHVHTHLREDSLALFGFCTEAEKELFLLLLGVSGIGPKLALAMLSTLSVQEIVQAIQASDDTKLCTISGIGKKTAARMVLELKDKIKNLTPAVCSPGHGPGFSAEGEDALSALINLGYKRSQAEEALRKVQTDQPNLLLGERIKQALGVLLKR
jgi:holliday junction DNA helicase RuvA